MVDVERAVLGDQLGVNLGWQHRMDRAQCHLRLHQRIGVGVSICVAHAEVQNHVIDQLANRTLRIGSEGIDRFGDFGEARPAALFVDFVVIAFEGQTTQGSKEFEVVALDHSSVVHTPVRSGDDGGGDVEHRGQLGGDGGQTDVGSQSESEHLCCGRAGEQFVLDTHHVGAWVTSCRDTPTVSETDNCHLVDQGLGIDRGRSRLGSPVRNSEGERTGKVAAANLEETVEQMVGDVVGLSQLEPSRLWWGERVDEGSNRCRWVTLVRPRKASRHEVGGIEAVRERELVRPWFGQRADQTVVEKHLEGSLHAAGSSAESLRSLVHVYQEPEFLPWDGRRVPLTFVGGYLGSGKTTLINEVLATTDRPIAVMVNDVGEVNIDAALIKKRSGDTIELTDGCVCCSLVDGFGAAFDQIRAREEPPDHLIVELSGVAQPERLAPWGKTAGFRLDGIVILIDVERCEDGLADPYLSDTLVSQITAADLLVLTKLDLVDADTAGRVRARLTELAPGTPLVDVANAKDASTLLTLGGRRPGGVDDVPDSTLFDKHVVERRPLAVGIERSALDAILAGLAADVVRAKGIAQLDDGSMVLIQVVGRRVEVTPLPQAENQPATDLVVISLPR